ncbi:hypothetical protein [Photobacterium halotolerans]|uniref:hypothetical protein n=1 Tax=Photobacterium halotolerans TaxID=265726 RepID=UPI00047F98FB|nr:hypothetical protein [Photobacterium halotolerans]
MKLRPLHDWVVVERDLVHTQEKAFILPSTSLSLGRVIAVGPLVKGIELGDRVRFNLYAGLVVTGEVSVTFVHEDDITGLMQCYD